MCAAEIELPGFELLSELGRGSDSVVYRARATTRECAIKISHRSEHTQQWFRREAAALARIKHPGIPAVLDVGEHAGYVYLAMELVRGETLQFRLANGLLTPKQTVLLGLRLADIVRALHDRGLVHRDIKPNNIIIDAGQRERLVDFGFATPLRPHRGLEDIAGTRRYAAPEQLVSPRGADGRADLFALGRVLLECLGPRRNAPTSSEETALRAVLAYLVANDPMDRYTCAAAFIDDLHRIVDGDAPAGPDAPPAYLAQIHRPTIGRRHELQHLEDAWLRAKASEGGAVMLEGAAGSGKSHVVDEALHRAALSAPHAACLIHTALPGELPFSAVRNLLRQFLDTDGLLEESERSARQEIAVTAAQGPAAPLLAAIFPEIGNLLEGPHPAVERACGPLIEAAATFLIALARRERPLFVGLDDAAWIDPLSREILVRVAVLASNSPLLVVTATRPEQREVATVKRFRDTVDQNRRVTIELSPLTDEDVAQLIEADLLFTPEPRLTHWVSGLSGDTPLGVLEALGALIDAGALQPHWGSWKFDPGLAQRAPLPRGVEANIRRRLALLAPVTRRALDVAAVIGSVFDPALVAHALSIDTPELQFARVEASRAGLLIAGHGNEMRFIHQGACDAVLTTIPAPDRARLHQRVAQTLRQCDANASIFDIAHHYAEGTLETPDEAVIVGNEAAAAASESLDHERVLACLNLVERAAKRLDRTPDSPFYRQRAEALIGVGDLHGSLVALHQCFSLAPSHDHGHILARIAWVHQAQGDRTTAQTSLERAFSALGEPFPNRGIAQIPSTAATMIRRRMKRARSPATTPAERERLALLYELYYQHARLGVEFRAPLDVLNSAVTILSIGDRVGPSPTQARAYATYGMFMTVLGRPKRGSQYLHLAEKMARHERGTSALADTAQSAFMGACFRGDLDDALRHAKRCLDDHGHWLEATEVCLNASTASLIESIRGRPRQGLAWLERARSRCRRQGRAPDVYRHVIQPAIAAHLACMGQDNESDYDNETSPDADLSQATGPQRLMSWGPQAIVELERHNRTGLAELERTFQSERHNPCRVHPVVAEYYIAIAHARATDGLRTPLRDRPAALTRLDRALEDLRKIAGVKLFVAHLEVLRGIRAVIAGQESTAEQRLSAAQRLAIEECAPWVTFTALRALAHLRRSQQRHDDALKFAHEALVVAQQHDMVQRAKLLREEFGLGDSAEGASSRASSQSRQLRALTQVLNATPQHGLEDVARSVVGELRAAVHAERAALLFQRNPDQDPRHHLIIGQTAAGDDWNPSDHNELLQTLFEHGDVVLHNRKTALPAGTLAVPLVIQTKRVGSMVLERRATDSPFSDAELGLFMSLCAQASVALELSRVLAERDQLQNKLQHAQRMEAAGQLASGIAHDFNNMLTAIFASLDCIEDPEDNAPASEHFTVIRECARRSSALIRQLLAFSRRQLLEMSTIDARDVVADLLPLVRHVAGPHTVVRVQCHKDPCPVYTERISLENAIINLVANARDAMQGGGTLIVRVDPGRLPPTSGHVSYTRIEVEDSGIGMSAEVQRRLFEPFFTTKSLGSGTGLGLASVYGFINQCGGRIDVASTPGQGSTFTIHLPTAGHHRQRRLRTPTPKPTPRTMPTIIPGGAKVLWVDDEEVIRSIFRTKLESAGFHVVAAGDGQEALELVKGGLRPDLVVTDIQMPQLSGPELVERLAQLGCQTRVLFISGFASNEWLDLAGPESEVLLKPFRYCDIEAKVIEALSRPPTLGGKNDSTTRRPR